ncbi:syntaxin-binding protein 6-like [Scleropages formosus]|uniref:Syntaxin-binding protein 6-like n=1 Tax=Scleropages formosus TaxID=113540 RepID=A0A0P7WK62_SCLFO|nr:syntaxin-binding protein 6-like [Scleropages formosus]
MRKGGGARGKLPTAETNCRLYVFPPGTPSERARQETRWRQTANACPITAFQNPAHARTFVPEPHDNTAVLKVLPPNTLTNKKPPQLSITKVKQFEGSSSFARRSQWTVDQLRQVNGIDPNRDCPEFDLVFDNASDQWVAGSAGEKCTFVQILHHACQRHSGERKPEFINCQSKLLGGNSILHSAAGSVTSAVQKASQALNERQERLGRAEEKTGELMNSAQQFADTAHKLAMKHKC